MSLAEAARRLASVLREENAALAAMDFARAGALLGAKHAAADGLAAATKSAAAGNGGEALRELTVLAEENRRLLNRALRVQRRVLDVVARAARQNGGPARYDTNGKAQPGVSPPRSLLARI